MLSRRFCISFSFKKTKMVIFGNSKDLGATAPVTIYQQPIEIVDVWRYLGFNIQGGKCFSFSAQPELASFRRAANCLLNTFYRPSEEVMMRLLYSNCVPILTYGAQVKQYHYADTLAVSVAVNDCIRKIFVYHRWISIRDLRSQMGYHSIEEIFQSLKIRFLNKARESDNPVVKGLTAF